MKHIYILALFIFCGTLTLDAQKIQNRWITSAGSPGWDVVTDMTICPTGDILILGAFYDSIDFKGTKLYSEGSRDVFIAKYNSQGNCQSSFSFGGVGFDYPIKVKAIGQENLVVAFKHNQAIKIAGREVPGINDSTYSIAWLNAGNKVNCINNIGSSGKSGLADLAVATDSTLWTCGWFEDTLFVADKEYIAQSDKDIFLAKFSNTGSLQWFKQFSGKGNDQALVLCPGMDNGMYISGITTGGCFGKEFAPDSAKHTGEFLFLAKVDLNGVISKLSYPVQGTDIIPNGIVEIDSTVFIASSFSDTVKINNSDVEVCKSKRDILLLSNKYSITKWKFQHLKSDLVATPISLCKYRDGIILTGQFSGTFDLSENKQSTSTKGSDIFILSVSSDGNIGNPFVLSGLGFNFPTALAVSEQIIYVAGEFPDSLGNEAGSLKSNGQEDIFLSQYVNCYLNKSVNIQMDEANLGGITYYDLKAESGYASYRWNNSESTSPEFSTTVPGINNVEVIDTIGCKYTQSIKSSEVHIKISDNQKLNNYKFRIYPTVTNNNIVNWEPDATWNLDAPVMIGVYNSAGLEISQQTLAISQYGLYSIDLSKVTNGTYYIKFTGQNFEQKSKVIVIR